MATALREARAWSMRVEVAEGVRKSPRRTSVKKAAWSTAGEGEDSNGEAARGLQREEARGDSSEDSSEGSGGRPVERETGNESGQGTDSGGGKTRERGMRV